MAQNPIRPVAQTAHKRLWTGLVGMLSITLWLAAGCGGSQTIRPTEPDVPTPVHETAPATATAVAQQPVIERVPVPRPTSTPTTRPAAVSRPPAPSAITPAVPITGGIGGMRSGELTAPAASVTTTTNVGPVAAFVRAGVLYIQENPPTGATLAVDDCGDVACTFSYLKWSPDGNRLLYAYHTVDGSAPPQIRVADRTGAVQTVAGNSAAWRPADWSPDGSRIVYLVPTGRYTESTAFGQEHILEVWTVEQSGGELADPELSGEVGFGEGCGGGGRSESANVYEKEGGFAYGYLAAIVEWTPGDLLLFSNNCTSRGVGRFDLKTGELLAPYPGSLRSLSLDGQGEAWVAIDDQNQVVIGATDSDEVAPVATEFQPELVFYGGQSGDLYYTTLVMTGTAEAVAALGALDPAIQVSPYFDFTRPSLRKIERESQAESLLWEGEDYAYARVYEGANGEIFFSRVETGNELYQAIQSGEITAENQEAYLPQVDVLLLAPDAAEPAIWLPDAQHFTPSQP